MRIRRGRGRSLGHSQSSSPAGVVEGVLGWVLKGCYLSVGTLPLCKGLLCSLAVLPISAVPAQEVLLV